MAALLGAELGAGGEDRRRGQRGGRKSAKSPTTMAAGQIVISGAKTAIDRAIEIAKDKRRQARHAAAGVRALPLRADAAGRRCHGAKRWPRSRSSRRSCRWSPMSWPRRSRDPAEIRKLAGGAGDRHRALARMHGLYARHGRRPLRRNRRGQGADRAGQAHRQGRRGRCDVGDRPPTSKRFFDDGLSRLETREFFDVRSEHPARPRSSPAPRGGIGGAIARACMSRARPWCCPARAARRWRARRPNWARRVHRRALQSLRQGLGRKLVPEAEALARPARHPGQQCRHDPRQPVPAHEGRGLGDGADGQPHRRLPPVARRAAGHDEEPLGPHRQHHFDRRRHRQSRPGQLRRLQGRA